MILKEIYGINLFIYYRELNSERLLESYKSIINTYLKNFKTIEILSNNRIEKKLVLLFIKYERKKLKYT